ncbi:MAG: nitroreductase family protein [Gemmatimonadota bacterium]
MSEIKRARPDHPIADLLAKRWSPYVFDPQPVADDELRSLFEAARWAPSSYNEQPWRFLVARRDDPPGFERMLSCLVEGNQAWARQVPVLALGIVSLGFERNGEPNRAAHHDLGLAAANLSVEATRRGLSVHQMIGILPERAREIYAIPGGFEPLTALAIGYRGAPDEAPPELRQRDERPRSRRKLPEFVFAGAWGEPLWRS